MTWPIVMIVAAAVYRLLPHPWNVAPMSALALCGGMYLGKRYALLVPIAAMVLSDLFIGFTIVTPFVYACFVASGLFGLWVRDRKNAAWITTGTIGGSLLFFTVTNLAHWALTDMYPKTAAGLLQCYDSAIPFFRGTLVGDALFVAAFVAVMELAARSARRVVPA